MSNGRRGCEYRNCGINNSYYKAYSRSFFVNLFNWGVQSTCLSAHLQLGFYSSIIMVNMYIFIFLSVIYYKIEYYNYYIG